MPRESPKDFELGKIYTATYTGNYKEELAQLEKMTPDYVFFPHSTYHTTRIDGAFTANKRILNEQKRLS